MAEAKGHSRSSYVHSIIRSLTEEGGAAGHVSRGFLKAFLAFALPVSLFKRKLSLGTLQRAAALGLFVGGVRLSDRLAVPPFHFLRFLPNLCRSYLMFSCISISSIFRAE